MAVRTTMTELITELRSLINDSGASQFFTDQQLQDCLDQRGHQVEYEQLQAQAKVNTSGVTEYKVFASPHKYWEADAQLVSGSYLELTPTAADYKLGEWTFSTTQNLPVLVYGRWYDINMAAADLWDRKADVYAERTDFSVDGGNYSESQLYKQAIANASKYRSRAVGGSGITHMRRSDVRQ